LSAPWQRLRLPCLLLPPLLHRFPNWLLHQPLNQQLQLRRDCGLQK
jgi:hypothetical protein